MSKPRSATSIIAELQEGACVAELSQAIHDAVAAVREHGKKATVSLELTIAPLREGAEKLVNAPYVVTPRIISKLPQADPPATVFFGDKDGNLTQVPEPRQASIGLNIAKNS